MDRRKQRKYIAKEDVALPAIQLESIILSLIINAKETRDVDIADGVSTYLLEDMEDYMLVKLTGKTVDIMCEVISEYHIFLE